VGFLRSVGDPRITSCLIAALATVFSGMFLYGLLSRYVDAALSRYVTFLLFMIPSVQIYYSASGWLPFSALARFSSSPCWEATSLFVGSDIAWRWQASRS